MIDFFKLGHLADELPARLSYGQQKLLDAAMAFMAGPRLVLLDEPAGGVNLDHAGRQSEGPAEGRSIEERGATFVVIEHNMDFVMSLCTRVLVLAEGRGAGRGLARRGARQSGGHRGLSWTLIRSSRWTTSSPATAR